MLEIDKCIKSVASWYRNASMMPRKIQLIALLLGHVKMVEMLHRYIATIIFWPTQLRDHASWLPTAMGISSRNLVFIYRPSTPSTVDDPLASPT